MPDWIYRLADRPRKRSEIFLWRDLTSAERVALEIASPPLYPAHLSPFAEEETREPLNSIGLRMSDGTIAGWMITHRIAPDTIRYSTLFVREDLQGSGAGAVLLAEAIRRQATSHVPNGCFGVNVNNHRTLSLVTRMGPIVADRRITKGTQKTLRGQPSVVL